MEREPNPIQGALAQAGGSSANPGALGGSLVTETLAYDGGRPVPVHTRRRPAEAIVFGPLAVCDRRCARFAVLPFFHMI